MTDIERIEKKVDELDKKQDETLRTVIEIKTQIRDYNGLREKVDSAKNTATSADKKIDAHCAKRDRTNGLVIATGLAFLGNIAMLIITSLIK